MAKTDEELLQGIARFAPDGAELDMSTCMRDGLVLLRFLEDWTGVHYPKNPEPASDSDRYKNVTIALQVLLGLFDMELTFTPQGLVDGDEVETRALLELLCSEEFKDMEMDDTVLGEFSATEKMREELFKKFDPAECDLSAYDEAKVLLLQCLARSMCAKKKLAKLRKRIDDRIQRMMEIVTTERTYVRGLEALTKVFREQLEFNESVSPEPLMNHEDRVAVFSNSGEIYSYNSTVLEALEERVANPDYNSCIGDVLLNMAPFLSLYTHYCNNYDHSIELLDQLRKKDAKLEEFLQQCKSHPLSQNLEVVDLLITPVQRVPRYILLIQELLRHTPQIHPDHENLTKAYTAIKSQMASVNDKIGKTQKMHEVLLIQQKIVGDDVPSIVMPSRIFVREGTLRRHNPDAKQGKENESVHLFVFNDCIVHTKKEATNKYKFRGLIPILEGNCRVKDIPDMGVVQNAFNIIAPDHSLTLGCASLEEKLEWMHELNKQIALGMEVRHQRFQSMKLAEAPKLEKAPSGVHNLIATITGTKVLHEKGDPFTCYCIQVTPTDRDGATYTVYRRYREFDELHRALRKKFSKHSFVPLPKKHFINNLKSDIVESRRIVLETFLEDALMKPEVCTSSELVIFLMPSDNYTEAQTLSTKTKATKLKQPDYLKEQAKLKKLQEKKVKKEKEGRKRGSIFFGGKKEKKEKKGKSSLGMTSMGIGSGEGNETPELDLRQHTKRAATMDVLVSPRQAELLAATAKLRSHSKIEEPVTTSIAQAAESPEVRPSPPLSGRPQLKSSASSPSVARNQVGGAVSHNRPVEGGSGAITVPKSSPVPPSRLATSPPTPAARVPSSPATAPRLAVSPRGGPRKPGMPVVRGRGRGMRGRGGRGRPLPTPGVPPTPGSVPPKPTTAPPKPAGVPPKPASVPPRPVRADAPPPPIPRQPPPSSVPELDIDVLPSRPPPPVPLE